MKGSKMDVDAALNKFYADKGWGKPTQIVGFPRLPLLYRSDFSDGSGYAVVRNGTVTETKGVDALTNYMKDVALLSQHGLEVSDMTLLIDVFEAYPPEKDTPDSSYYVAGKFLDKLKPTLEHSADHIKLKLSYLIPNRGGAVANPHVITLRRWTLDISKSYTATWNSESTPFDTSK